MKLYCEPGALSAELKALQRQGLVSLIHFAFDNGSHTHKISHGAEPAGAQWNDITYSWEQLFQLGITWEAMQARGKLQEITAIVGHNNRRDALHVNSAYLSGCPEMVTCDTDILDHRVQLEALLQVRIFHPDTDAGALASFVSASGAV